MANNQGPWGGGGNSGGNNGSGGDNGGDRRPPERRPDDMPDIDELMNKGREQLRVLMGGGKDGGNGRSGGPRGGGQGPEITRGMVGLGALAVAALWAFSSFYTVRPEEKSVELFLGSYSQTGEPGLNFAPWPVVTKEVVAVTSERTLDIGTSSSGLDAGLMLTGDENIVDIDFQVVWNIIDPAQYLFNLADPQATIAAVAESAMREIIAQSDLAPILNRDRGAIADRLKEMIQDTLDSYDSGVNIVRVNFDKADPPEPVIAAFRKVQDAEQERDRLQNVARAYSNQVTAEARGKATEIIQQAEAYRARVVNEAEGEASRFAAVLEEYAKAPEVTRKRLYLETMEQVLGNVDMVLLDGDGAGAVPYLPLNQLTTRPAPQTGESN
ncbi:MAG: FtsH protease activity modulator HflK [Rhodobacterales bacterium]|nr:MAG: FtsH protease activity modulator HflK [Rhodobacterales bacterium]